MELTLMRLLCFDHENNLFLKLNFDFVLTVSKILCERDFHPSIVSDKGLLIFVSRSQLAGRTLVEIDKHFIRVVMIIYYPQHRIINKICNNLRFSGFSVFSRLVR